MPDDEPGRSPEAEQPTRSGKGTPADSSGETALPHKRLGDFELLREIGRGGMGIVYEARQISLKRRVALKVLPPGLGLTEQAVKRFEREAQAAAKLHHTNIVPVYATGQDQGCHYYAMELVDGQSLSRVLDDLRGARSNPLMEATVTFVAGNAEARVDGRSETAESTSLSDTGTGSRQWFHTVAGLLADVGDALQHAHASGVIHRDIKPANLLLSGDGRLSVGDFGLARVAQEPGMTVSGSFLGTPAYMSPEQIAVGRVNLDHRTDVYSLGAVLYEMLTLQRPFPGESREQILSGILSKDPKAPRRINPRVPLDLETICLKAMEKDPDRRYATAEAMAEDLQQYRQGGLIAARRAGPVRRTVKLVRRHPVAAVSSIALVIILALGTFAWRLAGRQSEEAAMRAVSDARFFMSQGDYRESLETIDAVLAVSPGIPEARLMRARLLMKLDRSREAVAEAQAILEHDPDDWKGHLVLALAARRADPGIRALNLSAEEHLQVVEQAAPETADAYYLRGLIEEDDRGALEFLDRSLALDPAHADALMERCQRHVDLKNFQAALLDGERLASLRPRSAQGRRTIGEIHQAMHDADQALLELEKAIQLDPDDPATFMARAAILRELGREEEALADLTRAIELDPDYARSYAQRSWTYQALRRFEEAITDAERAIELNPELDGGFFALATAHEETGQRDEADAIVEEFLARAAEWQDKGTLLFVLENLAWMKWKRGDADGAFSAVDRAIEVGPDEPRAYGLRANLLERAGDRDGFEAACDRLESLEPTELDRWIELGDYLRFTCERVDAAVAAFSTIITLATGWADPFAWRAYMYHLQNRYDEALADYARSLELAPRWTEVYKWRAEAYRDMERFEDAVRDFSQCLELGDEDVYVRVMRARALARLGREDEAFEDLDFNIRRLPDYGAAYRARGLQFAYLGRLEKALADMDRGIEVDPGDPWNYAARMRFALLHSGSCDAAARDMQKIEELASPHDWAAWIWVSRAHVIYLARYCPELFDPDRALELAERALELTPLDAWYHQVHGVALYRQGRFEESRAALERGFELEFKPDPTYLFFLAMTHWKLGDRDAARHTYDRAQSRLYATWPDHPEILAARREAADLLGLQP